MKPLRFLCWYLAIKLVEVWVFALRDVLREERAKRPPRGVSYSCDCGQIHATMPIGRQPCCGSEGG